MKRKATEQPQSEATFYVSIDGNSMELDLTASDEINVRRNLKEVESQCREAQAEFPHKSKIEIVSVFFAHRYIDYIKNPNDARNIAIMHFNADYIRSNSDYVGIAYWGDLDGELETLLLNKDELTGVIKLTLSDEADLDALEVEIERLKRLKLISTTEQQNTEGEEHEQ